MTLTKTMKTEADSSRTWRYASARPAPLGILFTMQLRGESNSVTRHHEGRMFYRMNEGYLSIHDPANGGYPVVEIERGIIKHLDISAA